MKKKLFGIMLVFAVVLFAGYTAYNSHGDIKLSDVTLANLEALADENDDNSEAGGASHSCYKKWRKAPEVVLCLNSFFPQVRLLVNSLKELER